MTLAEHKKALACAVKAARLVGRLMRQNLHIDKKVNSATAHDIKLELDVRSQKLIEKTLLQSFPKVAVLGEEGVSGDQSADSRWVVDPIDGTVNSHMRFRTPVFPSHCRRRIKPAANM